MQAVVAQQDSRIELQKVFMSKSKLPVRTNSSVLLEKEKYRNLEKQKEELANLHKQQVQHQAEQQRWEKEKERQRLLIESQEAELQQRQEECRKMEEKLNERDLELKQIWETYQNDLERQRETSRKLEKEKEQVNREKERLEKMKSKLIPNYDDPTRVRAGENLIYHVFWYKRALFSVECFMILVSCLHYIILSFPSPLHSPTYHHSGAP